MLTNGEISLYFHIPFCKHKCPYCHFYVIADKECFKDQLLASLKLEWQRLQPTLEGRKIVSIYFGGGTPTLFGIRRLEAILQMIPCGSDVEITIETNPEEIHNFRQFQEIGINRVSLGVQSLDENELAILDRRHAPAQAIETVYAIKKASIDNITIDLMYDLPSQTERSWIRTLDAAAKLPITHLSLYNLTIEEHTAFFRRQEKIRKEMPSEELSVKMYLDAIKMLESSGLMQYEISAFCKDTLYSRHNIGYWKGRHFYGLGPSAFSFDGVARFRNVANLARYTKLLEQNESPVDFSEAQDPESLKRELLALNLRLIQGADLACFHPLAPDTQKALHKLQDIGLLLLENNRARLSQRGILFYDSVATELI